MTRHGMTGAQRFEMKIDRSDPNGCWHWKGKVNKRGRGYGAFAYKVAGKAVTELAHRYAYKLWVGPIDPGMQIDHVWPRCMHADCVRPDHLEQVTAAENTRRYLASRTECRAGHSYAEFGYQGTAGMRCRECERIKNRKYWRKNHPADGPKPPLKTHCKNGHKFTPENTKMGGKLGTTRLCRQCARDAVRESRKRLHPPKPRAAPKPAPPPKTHPRDTTHCKRGHEFTIGNTRYVTHKDGRTQRLCRECDKERRQRWEAKHSLLTSST